MRSCLTRDRRDVILTPSVCWPVPFAHVVAVRLIADQQPTGELCPGNFTSCGAKSLPCANFAANIVANRPQPAGLAGAARVPYMPHILPVLPHKSSEKARSAGACERSLRPNRVLYSCVLFVVGALALAACSQPEATVAQVSQPPTPIIVVAPPMEVTRVVYSEQIVVATPTPPHACAPQTLSEAEEIVVALIAPISDAASLPTSLGVQAALAAAVSEINSGGGVEGVPLRLHIADASGSPEEVAQRAEESITEQCVSAIIGSGSSAVAHAVLEVAHRYGLPFFVVDAADDALTATGYPEIFRLAPTNSMLVASPGDWLTAVGDFNNDGQLSALVIVEEGNTAATHGEWMENELQRRGFTTDTYSVMLPSQDFSSLVARIVTRPVMPDVIFNRIGGDPGLMLERQLLDNGIGPQKQSLIVASRSALLDEHFWSIVGPDGVNTIVGRVGPVEINRERHGSTPGRRFCTLYGSLAGGAEFCSLRRPSPAGRGNGTQPEPCRK